MTNDQRFMKRLYSPRAFYRLLTDMLLNIRDMREAEKILRVNREFSERIMMAVTEVNDCRYWPYFHTHVAIYAGMIPAVFIQQAIRKLVNRSKNCTI